MIEVHLLKKVLKLRTSLFKMSSFYIYLLQTYMVTSKPKRISVALGVVHIIMSPFIRFCKLTTIIIRLVLQFINNKELVYGK